ncbi:MAG: tetratricopeptide repeat protein [Acidobacteriia bacterium]|nr:tetratricopeptide repeat protein [Terriglobia bacterium]
MATQDAPGGHATTLMWAAMLVILALAVFWPATRCQFLYLDDGLYVVFNPHVKQGLSRGGLVWAFNVGYTGNWHPVTWLSHMLDVELFGLDPGSHHRTSLLLHAANGILLFLLLQALLVRAPPPGVSRPRSLAAVAAIATAIFLVHPLRIESVAWVAERKDVLAGFFWLAATLAYARFAERWTAKRYVLVSALLALGLMAKPMLVSLPVVFLLLDFWPLDRSATAPRRLIVEKLPWIGLAAASVIITLVAQRGAISSMTVVSVGARVANALVSYVAYVRALLWPSGLCVFYPFREEGWPAVQVLGAGVLLVTATTLACLGSRRHGWLATGWFWYLVTLVPVIGLVQVGGQARADRYTYIPHIGLLIVVMWGALRVAHAIPRGRSVLSALALAAIVALSCVTVRDLRYWHDSVSLFDRAVAVTEDNYFAHFLLGLEYAHQGRFEEAEWHTRVTLRIRPAYFPAYDHLGYCLASQGRLEEAIVEIRRGIALRPDQGWAHFTLGSVLLRANRIPEAVPSLERAVELDPTIAPAWVDLGQAYEKTGQTGRAEPAYRRALGEDPDQYEGRLDLGILLVKSGRYDQAETQLGAAAELRPDSPAPHLWLAALSLQRGDLIRARDEYLALLPLDAEMAKAVLKDIEGYHTVPPH